MSSTTESLTKSFSNLLRSLDYFAVTFEFRVDKKPRFGSIIGGLSFLIYIIIGIIFCIKSFSDYNTLVDTKIIFIEKDEEISPNLNYKTLNFSYAIQITFDNDTILKNTDLENLFILEHAYTQVNKTSSKPKSINKTSPRPCTEKDFYNQSQDYSIFHRQNISKFECFDFSDEYMLKGIYTDNEMFYSQINLSLNQTFLDKYELIQKIFEENLFKFSLIYKDTFYDVSDFKSPIFYRIDSIYSNLDLKYLKIRNVDFHLFSFEQDQNLFYKEFQKKSYIKKFSTHEILTPIDNRKYSKLKDKNILFKFYIRAVNNVKIIKISLVKIPEFLASVSVVLVNSLVILNIIISMINNLEAKQSIMSKIMKYKDVILSNHQQTMDYLEKKFVNEDFKKKNSLKNINLNNEEIKSHQNNVLETNNSMHIMGLDLSYNKNTEKNLRNNLITETDGKRIDNKTKLPVFIEKFKNKAKKDQNNLLNTLLSKPNNPFFIKISDICCLVLCCKKMGKKKIIFDNAERKFNNNIDLVTYMNKMQEVEILKYLLLDRDTLQLMNFISKPCISMTTQGIENEEYNLFFHKLEEINMMSNENIDVVKKSYDKVNEKRNKTFVDERIIKLFELQMEEILQ